jgi:hypothetical protein
MASSEAYSVIVPGQRFIAPPVARGWRSVVVWLLIARVVIREHRRLTAPG